MNHASNNQIKPEADKLRLLADYWITFDNMSFDFNISSLKIEEESWKIKR
ncbi:MAG: hypothetical protein HC830_06280 [Bacteroidetes bacterium]|nr:hypothetical protein [Bacteroidota bacterium]